MPGFPARVNTSTDPVRPGFEDHDLESVGSQDRGSAKAGNTGTDHDDIFLGWNAIFRRWLLCVLTHNFKGQYRAQGLSG